MRLTRHAMYRIEGRTCSVTRSGEGLASVTFGRSSGVKIRSELSLLAVSVAPPTCIRWPCHYKRWPA
jgi:hypothetical protein